MPSPRTEGEVLTFNDNLMLEEDSMNPVENKKPSELKEQIRTWLNENGWRVQQQKARPETMWALAATDSQGQKIVVGQTVDRENAITLKASITFDNSTNDRLSSLSKRDRNGFLWDLRFELLRADLEFQGVEHPIQGITVVRRVFLDALTEDTFLHRASQVRKGVLIVQWLLAKVLQQQPGREQIGFTTT